MRVLVIGLGSMGLGAAISLLRQNIETVGLDLRPEAIDSFRREGGTAADSIDQYEQFDAILLFVINATQVKSALFSKQLFDHLRPKALIINCATIAPSDTVDIYQQVTERGFRYIDAPVSGGATKAKEGTISIMASASPEAMIDAMQIFDAISEKVFHLSNSPGAGSQMKLINQLLAGIHIVAAAEAMNLAQSLNMNLHQVIDVIKHSAGSSWMFENRAPHIAEGNYSPLSTVNIFVKDLGIVTKEASRQSVVTPLSDAALTLFKEAADRGLGEEDDSAVVKVLAKRSDVTLPGSSS